MVLKIGKLIQLGIGLSETGMFHVIDYKRLEVNVPSIYINASNLCMFSLWDQVEVQSLFFFFFALLKNFLCPIIQNIIVINYFINNIF